MSRFLQNGEAEKLKQVDLDNTLWMCWGDSYLRACLIETAIDIGQGNKHCMATKTQAQMAGIPGLVVLYSLDKESQNPADEGKHDIKQFRVCMVHPEDWGEFRIFTPAEYAQLCVDVRRMGVQQLVKHMCKGD